MSLRPFLHQFEKLERLIDKLPEGIQKPIRRELTPMKELFLQQRPPRIALAGDPGADAAALFSALFNGPLPSDAAGGGRGWQEVSRPGRGSIRVLDARPAAANIPLPDAARVALSAEAPDLVLWLQPAAGSGAGPSLDPLQTLLQFTRDRHDTRPPVVPVTVAGPLDEPSSGELDAARLRLAAAFSDRTDLGGHATSALAVATAVRFRPDGSPDDGSDHRAGLDSLANTLVAELPNEAKLDMARLSGARAAQKEIANKLIKSVAAASGAIGAQPIPLADMPILLALQVMMIVGVIYVSGGEANVRTAGRFFGALGLQFGAGLVFREVSRALVKFFPGWGNAISGLVAAGGTWALGRAATAHFIDGVGIKEARRLFRRKRREGAEVVSRES